MRRTGHAERAGAASSLGREDSDLRDRLDEVRPKPAKSALAGPAFERHYSVEELCELWQMSDDFLRRLFLREPGVVIFYHQRPGRRVYRTLRIPASVAERVHRKMQREER